MQRPAQGRRKGLLEPPTGPVVGTHTQGAAQSMHTPVECSHQLQGFPMLVHHIQVICPHPAAGIARMMKMQSCRQLLLLSEI